MTRLGNTMFIILLVSPLTTSVKFGDTNETFANGITQENLNKHVITLASKKAEGRMVTTRGEEFAANYIENSFIKSGVFPANSGEFRMYFPVWQDTILNAEININNRHFEINKDFTLSFEGQLALSFKLGEIVFINSKVLLTLIDKFDFKGKLILIDSNLTQSPILGKISDMFFEAAGIMIIAPNFQKTISKIPILSKQIFKSRIEPCIFFISKEMGNNILAGVKRRGSTSPIVCNSDISISIAKQQIKRTGINLLGLIPGSDLKSEMLILTAHYDHLGMSDSIVYCGADDNASGVASLLEIAQAFSLAKIKGMGPRRSILFFATSGEEFGMWGSSYYTKHPIFPLKKTKFCLNLDMIGRIDDKHFNSTDSANYLYTIGFDKLNLELQSICAYINQKYVRLKIPKYTGNDDKVSDQVPFAEAGIPVLFYSDGYAHTYPGDYHEFTDTPDKINYGLLIKRTKLAFYTIWEIANRNFDIPTDVKLPTLKLY